MPKRFYVGVPGTVVCESNVSEYFYVQNGSPYYFACVRGVWGSNNRYIGGSTATTTLTAKGDFSSVSFSYSFSGELDCDKFTLTVAGTVVADGLSGPPTTKFFTGPLKAGDKIELKYQKDKNTDYYDDCGTLSGLTIGTKEEVARMVKQAYIGADDKARRIKKAYIGVGGVARPCFVTEPWPSYFGTTNSLSAIRNTAAATTVGDYALFGGGIRYVTGSYSYYSTVDAYSSSLTHSTPTPLSVGRRDLAATTVGNYALFGGGRQEDGRDHYSTVDAYSSSLTRSTPTPLSVGRRDLAATTVGNYALFGGGRDSSYFTSAVDAYSSSLTRSAPAGLFMRRDSLAATTVGNYALFGGGYSDGNYQSAVDAYSSSLTRSTPTRLLMRRNGLAATTVGNYALFGGGVPEYKAVEAYNSSLTRNTLTEFPALGDCLAATTVGNYALFGCGFVFDGISQPTVAIYMVS